MDEIQDLLVTLAQEVEFKNKHFKVFDEKTMLLDEFNKANNAVYARYQEIKAALKKYIELM